MRKKSQKQKILEWLLQGYSITPLEALNMFNTLRLGAIIFDLRKDGWNNINSKLIKTESGKWVAEYSMGE